MKGQRLLIAVTVVNLGLLMFALARMPLAVAQDIAPVMRDRALEIVDGQGRVRASITVHPADPTFTLPDGRPSAPPSRVQGLASAVNLIRPIFL